MDIILAEDATDQRFVIATALRNKGYNVVEVQNGIEALECLEKNKNIRLIISDWMMPNLNGLELCDHIRNKITDRYIYFILLSGKTDQHAIVEGMDRGADDFLYKPINFDELKARLYAGKRIISLKQKLEQKIHIIETDLKAAADTQLQMISKPNTLANVELNWSFKPSMYLGGDMLGYHFLDDDHICFYQLDVAGHGIPASLLSVKLNNVLSDFQSSSDLLMEKKPGSAILTPKDPNQVLQALNIRFQSETIDMLYFTMIYGFINIKTGIISLSHAGHPHPILISCNKDKTITVAGEGTPIGLITNVTYNTSNINLQPKDKLFIYSDGLTDCNHYQNENEFFSKSRLTNLLARTNKLAINDIKTQLEQEITTWHGDQPVNDDITFLILEWNP